MGASSQRAFSPELVQAFANTARQGMRASDGKFRRDHLRALAQRVEVGDTEIRFYWVQKPPLRTLAATDSVKSAVAGIPSFIPGWLGD